GGYGASGTLLGAIQVSSTSGPITLSALTGGAGAYTQIGHGGVDAIGNKNGSIAVSSAGDLAILGGGASQAFSLIGHGGVQSDGYLYGRIDVEVGGNLDISGGTATYTFGQIGHSLAGARGGWGGLIEVGGLI